MNPKPDDDDGADLLMAKSKSALTRIPIAHLKAFCKDHDLTVSPTGKTGAIKKDYVATVWFHVSENIER
jgi:5,10-methylene-tetrahydrofolate dehydrogenase/methenyl tetrahydrofolate cyclohydrolase